MTHGNFHCHQFSTNIQLLKLAHFLESGRNDGHLAPLILFIAKGVKCNSWIFVSSSLPTRTYDPGNEGLQILARHAVGVAEGVAALAHAPLLPVPIPPFLAYSHSSVIKQIYKELHIIIFFAATKTETGVVGRWFADFLRGSVS
jgi:hypothetical protein